MLKNNKTAIQYIPFVLLHPQFRTTDFQVGAIKYCLCTIKVVPFPPDCVGRYGTASFTSRPSKGRKWKLLFGGVRSRERFLLRRDRFFLPNKGRSWSTYWTFADNVNIVGTKAEWREKEGGGSEAAPEELWIHAHFKIQRRYYFLNNTLHNSVSYIIRCKILAVHMKYLRKGSREIKRFKAKVQWLSKITSHRFQKRTIGSFLTFSQRCYENDYFERGLPSWTSIPLVDLVLWGHIINIKNNFNCEHSAISLLRIL